MGLIQAGVYYIGTSICFELRTGEMFCQDITNAVAYIMTREGHILLVCMDDMAGIAKTLVVAWQGYRQLKALPNELGLEEAKDKGQSPATRRRWLVNRMLDRLRAVQEGEPSQIG